MTSLQKTVEMMTEFCRGCDKNNTLNCNPQNGDYCMELAEKMVKQNEALRWAEKDGERK